MVWGFPGLFWYFSEGVSKIILQAQGKHIATRESENVCACLWTCQTMYERREVRDGYLCVWAVGSNAILTDQEVEDK